MNTTKLHENCAETHGVTEPGRPWGALWLIDAPWAHPVWHQYLLSISDLTTEIPGEPATRYRRDVTHDIQLIALKPERRFIVEDLELNLSAIHSAWLTPQNFVCQIRTPSNSSARLRLRMCAIDVACGNLNPDTDWRQSWFARFPDAAHPDGYRA